MTTLDQAVVVLLDLERNDQHDDGCRVERCHCRLYRNAHARAGALADAGLLKN